MKFKVLNLLLALVCTSSVFAGNCLSSDTDNRNVTRPNCQKQLVHKKLKARDLAVINIEKTAPTLHSLVFDDGIGNNNFVYRRFSQLLSYSINLQTLELLNTFLTEIPKEIWNLTNLQILLIRCSLLSELPSEIGNLVQLNELGVEGTQLTHLPKEIGKLINLKKLFLSYNRLTELPKELGNLHNLCMLYISDNFLTELPDDIGNLTKLYELRLEKNNLIKLPGRIGNLINLRNLELEGNQLTRLPKEIGNLTELQTLYLLDNQLVELPKEIGNLINLEMIDLSYNQLTEVPKEIGNLINLQHFICDHSAMQPISVVEDLRDSRIKADLRSKGLSQIPFDIVERAESLEELDVSDNNLAEIPELIVRCQDLQRINLSNNRKIDSVEKVSDGVFGLPYLESIILTTSEGQKKYGPYDILEIRKQRIKKLETDLLYKQIPCDLERKFINNILQYILLGKNKTKVSNRALQAMIQNTEEIQQQIVKHSCFKRQMLDRLMDIR